jgi:hypothetical protein
VITWRVPVAVLALIVCLSAIGYVVFPRPWHPQSGVTIKLPDRKPSNALWVWPDGTPGWQPGQTINGFLVAGAQPVEVAAAQLAAARQILDAESVRVIAATRGDRRGPLAILAAHTMYSTPETTCLAALLRGNAPVVWRCPKDPRGGITEKHVLIAAARFDWPGAAKPLYFVGVARGDVEQIVLVGGVSKRETLYTRAKTWGQFESAQATSPGAKLLVYGKRGLLETVRLDVPVGQQRVLR